MKARKFNSLMPKLNELWTARVLGMKLNTNSGPDLIDENKGVEVKFTLVGKKCGAETYTPGWTVLEYQMDYGRGLLPVFWGLATYELDKPVSRIKTENHERLDGYVLNRELWIVQWNWMEQFSPYQTSGKTKISSWNNILRYPKLRFLPEIMLSFPVEKGLVHLTEGVSPSNFNF